MKKPTDLEHFRIARDELLTSLACIEDRSVVKLSNIRIALAHARAACCRLLAIENSLSGYPKPKDD